RPSGARLRGRNPGEMIPMIVSYPPRTPMNTGGIPHLVQVYAPFIEKTRRSFDGRQRIEDPWPQLTRRNPPGWSRRSVSSERPARPGRRPSRRPVSSTCTTLVVWLAGRPGELNVELSFGRGLGDQRADLGVELDGELDLDLVGLQAARAEGLQGVGG